MDQNKKAPRKKPNANQIQRKIKDSLNRGYRFYFSDEDSVDFILPDENHLNRSLFFDLPLAHINDQGKVYPDGKLGQVKHFYIPKRVDTNLLSLFKEFKIPSEIFGDLTVSFLSMVFSASKAPHANYFHEEMKWKKKELVELFDLLEQFSNEKLFLKGVSFDYVEVLEKAGINKKPVLGPSGHKSYKGHLAAQFIEGLLQAFKNAEKYRIVKMIYDDEMVDKHDAFHGYKNAEQEAQGYFSNVIFKYLRNHLSVIAFSATKGDVREEINRLKKIYSRRQMFLFIAKLMSLSGLLQTPKDNDPEKLIQVIQKKLQRQLKAEKQREQAIHIKNRASQDGVMEVTPALWLF